VKKVKPGEAFKGTRDDLVEIEHPWYAEKGTGYAVKDVVGMYRYATCEENECFRATALGFIPRLSPEDFEKAMVAQLSPLPDGDPEAAHKEMDKLMCIVLRQLGYENGVEVFERQDKWYS